MFPKNIFILFVLSMAASLVRAEKTDLRLTGIQGVHKFYAISKPWASDAKHIGNVLMSACSMQDVCISHIWDSKDAAPARLPFTDKQVRTELATYQKNTNTGKSSLLFNCKVFKGFSKNECFGLMD